jgi:hypothetical protein
MEEIIESKAVGEESKFVIVYITTLEAYLVA